MGNGGNSIIYIIKCEKRRFLIRFLNTSTEGENLVKSGSKFQILGP